MTTHATPRTHPASLSVRAGTQQFEDRGVQESSLHLRLAQINPTSVVLTARRDEVVATGHPKPTVFNLSVVAEDGIVLTEVISGPTTRSLITLRQAEILTLVSDAYDRYEISALLGISCNTVDHHLKKIRERLNARTTTQAAVIATELKLIRRDPKSPAYIDQARLTSIDSSAATIRVDLTPLQLQIAIDDAERLILVGARGRVRVCQIRCVPNGRTRNRDALLLRAKATNRTDRAIAREAGVSGEAIRRRLRALCSSADYEVPPRTVAAQMGLTSQKRDVHAPAREWFQREIYQGDALADAVSPIFTTFDS